MNSKIVKVLFNGRVISAVVSAVSAVICACLAGCRLMCAELELQVGNCATNLIHKVTN